MPDSKPGHKVVGQTETGRLYSYSYVSLCPNCRPWAATSERQLAQRERNRAAFPDIQVHRCTVCGSDDWASTRECIVPERGVNIDAVSLGAIIAAGIVAGALIMLAVSLSFKPVVSVESRVMPFELSPRQIAERSFLTDATSTLCSDEEHMLRTLPVLQQAALIQMRESQVKRAVVARLLEECQDKPRVSDYEALTSMGLAEKGSADKWHRLTYLGRRISGHLEQRLCKQFQIHLLQEAGGDRFDVRYRCCCGWTTMVPKQSPSVWRNARARFTRHEASVIGIDNLTTALKPPVKAEIA